MMICLGLGKKVRTVVRRRDFAASKAEVVLEDIAVVVVVDSNWRTWARAPDQVCSPTG